LDITAEEWKEEITKMSKIVTQVEITNLKDPTRTIKLDALVDTGTSMLVLPLAWKERLGELDEISKVEMETVEQKIVEAYIYGPVKITIAGFRPVYGEVAFVEMEPIDGKYEVLLGYLPLEAAQAVVDMVKHRLVKVKAFDLK
jgi:hypothetical protein